MMSLLLVLVLRPRRKVLWLLAGWLTFSATGNAIVATRHASPNLLAFPAIVALVYVGIFRPAVLDPPAADVAPVFE